MKKKVFISTSTFAQYDSQPLDLLRNEGFEVGLNPHGRKLKSEELTDLANEAVGLIAGTENLDAQTLDQLPAIQVISRCGVGMDNVDCEAAATRSIKVYNTPDGPTLAVAELTLGLILNALRRIGFMDRSIRSGLWKKLMGELLNSKIVGIIGFGRIGRMVAEYLRGFGCTVLYYDTVVIKHEWAQPVSLSDLLSQSDIVTIHSSSAVEILGMAELALMKKHACLVNVARGGIVNEDALYQRLKGGDLAIAALDVFAEEPYRGPLIELDNIILTAHVGSYAREARVQMEVQSVHNLIEGLKC